MECLKRAAAYARFSSEMQREDSITAQLRAIDYYASQKGYQIVDTYADKAKSGRSTAERTEFLRMIEDSKQGKFEAVIVHKLDRFSRSAADTMKYELELRDNDVELISVTEQLDNSPEGELMKMIILGMNQFYSRNLAREVQKGMKENAYHCLHNGGIPALGYDVNPDHTYSINEAEAAIIRMIFDSYVNKGWGYKKIITELNAYGYRTKKNLPFGKNSIHELLKNPKYKGDFVYNAATPRNSKGVRNHHRLKPQDQVITIKNGIPAIISPELFDRAQQRLATNRKMPAAYKAKEVYLLSGRIYCGECGCLMNGNARVAQIGKSKYMSYRCNKRDRTKQCTNKEVRREYVESFVIQQLERNLLNDEIIPVLVKKINQYQNESDSHAVEERKALQAQLDEVSKQTGNIVTAITNGMYQDVFKQKMQELEKRRGDLIYRLERLDLAKDSPCFTEDMIRSYFSVMKRHVHDRNMPEIKRMIDQYVERVVVYQDRIDVHFKVALPQNDAAYQFDSDIDRKDVRKCWSKAG